MASRITEPPDTVNTFTAQGDTVIGHDPETVRAYREQAAEAARRGPTRVIPGKQPPAPSEAPLPFLGVARAVAGREIGRLKAEAAAIERDLQRGIVGPGGNVSEHLVTRQREARAYLEQIGAEIERIDSMDDEQVRRFAFELGAR